MGRNKAPDPNKVQKIIGVLQKNPRGLWISEIARRANLSKSTTHRYITEYMEDQIEEAVTVKGGLVKFVRLRKVGQMSQKMRPRFKNAQNFRKF